MSIGIRLRSTDVVLKSLTNLHVLGSFSVFQMLHLSFRVPGYSQGDGPLCVPQILEVRSH